MIADFRFSKAAICRNGVSMKDRIAGQGFPRRTKGNFAALLGLIMLALISAMGIISLTGAERIYASASGDGRVTFRFVALGNSVTSHPVCEFWFYECGMAASRPSKDYVHQTVSKIKKNHGKEYASYFFELVDSPLWELSAAHRKSIKKLLRKALQKETQLLVIQYGDNVRNASFFEAALTDLVVYIQKMSPDTRIIILGNLELKDRTGRTVEAIKKKVAKACGVSFVDLSPIAGKKKFQIGYKKIQDRKGKWHKIVYEAVAIHPNDRGMEWIAERIVSAYEEAEAEASAKEQDYQTDQQAGRTVQQNDQTDQRSWQDTAGQTASQEAALQQRLQKGLACEDGGWYFYKNGKAVHNRWVTIKSGKQLYRYYFGSDGKAVRGDEKSAKLVRIGKYIYAFNGRGRMMTGVHLINKKLYLFSKKGRYDKRNTAIIRERARYRRSAKKLTDILEKYGCRLKKKEFFGKGCLSDNEDGMYTFDHFKAAVYKYESGRIVVLDVLPL